MLEIQNLSRGTTLATRGRRARGFFERLLGLMFRASLAEGEGLLLEGEQSIHTCFMRFPIDVLYLDRDYCVLRAVHSMAPFKLGPLFTRHCHAILELPAGSIESTGTAVSDQLLVIER
jgi:uncharacterized membrane protein (UPF0127 family)